MISTVLYFISLIISLFDLIMVLIMTYGEEGVGVLKFFGYTECYTLIGISLVLLIIGLINAKEETEEIEL